MTFYDIEYIIIIVVLISVFFIGLKSRSIEYDKLYLPFVIDKQMAVALKGLACILILLGHWGQRKFDVDMPWGVSKVVWNTTANIGLVWFMFFFGYGMSLKKGTEEVGLDRWWHRMKKIYVPLFFVSVISVVLYVILPDCFSIGEIKQLWIPETIHQLHNFSMSDMLSIIKNMLGWGDWYVACILMFYTIFYFAVYISCKYKLNTTILLAIFFCIYYIWAYFYYGPLEGHYYRYVWAFLFGHAVAKRTKVSWIVVVVSLFTWYCEGKILWACFIIGIAILFLCSYLNLKYEMQSKCLLFLGGISYFYYLSHIRVGYVFITYMQIDSIIVWCILTTLIAYLFNKAYFYVVK